MLRGHLILKTIKHILSFDQIAQWLKTNTYIYKGQKHFFKTFRRMSSSVNSLYYTFKNFLLYFTVIFTIKLSLQ